jgi:hypothetical protein
MLQISELFPDVPEFVVTVGMQILGVACVHGIEVLVIGCLQEPLEAQWAFPSMVNRKVDEATPSRKVDLIEVPAFRLVRHTIAIGVEGLGHIVVELGPLIIVERPIKVFTMDLVERIQARLRRSDFQLFGGEHSGHVCCSRMAEVRPEDVTAKIKKYFVTAKIKIIS